MKFLKSMSVVLVAFIFLNILCFTAFAAEKLPAPTNLVWNGTVATWDLVENASAHRVEIYKNNVYKGSNINYTQKNTADFSNLIAENGEGRYTFRVIALGDGVNYIDSDPSVLSAVYGVMGDVNLDGTVTIKDVSEIQLHIAEITTLTETQLSLADVNKDDKMNISDATDIQKYLAGFIKKLG